MIQDSIRFCLVRTTHPGNIGATARAMKTMGLRRLYLVAPTRRPAEAMISRAAGAVDLLDEAVETATLGEALEHCTLVLGTTARERKIEWPLVDPEQAAALLAAEASRGRQAAVVFGTERNGLSNAEVEHCHHLIRIPTDDSYASLNVAAAAQIVAYELFKRGAVPPAVAAPMPAAADTGEMQGFYGHLQQTLRDLDFIKVDYPPVMLMRKLIRLFNRARPSREEILILRGILKAVQDSLKRRVAGRK